LYADKKNQYLPIWGVGVQVKAYQGLHLVGEIVGGDPYVPKSGIAYQAGLRYYINENMQIDTEFGQGITGVHKIPYWFGCGIRFAALNSGKKA